MDINTKFGYWIKVAPFTGFKLEKYGRPFNVGKHVVPENLNELSIGQLLELSDLSSDNDCIYDVCRIVLDMNRKEVDKARAVDVVMFCGWVMSEVEKITKLFSRSKSQPTAIEKKAGIEGLQFGMFGLLDWYALRMGITNHDDVLPVPWMRIYRCMDMDDKKAQFNKKLQEVMSDEYRRKNKRNSRK